MLVNGYTCTCIDVILSDKDSELAARILSALGLQNEEVTSMYIDT